LAHDRRSRGGSAAMGTFGGTGAPAFSLDRR
jgi:hypothetical protein